MRAPAVIALFLPALFAQAPIQFEARPEPLLPDPLPLAVVTGDFDGDGAPDIFATMAAASGAVLLRNDGSGLFAPAAPLLPQQSPFQQTFFVDADGDGDDDLLVSDFYSLRVVLSQPSGWTTVSLGVPPALPTVQWAAVGDFDGDGDLDLAGTGHPLSYGRSQLLENVGGGGFVSRQPFVGYGFGVAAADYDGDGDLDVAICGVTPELYRNDGGLVFTLVSATSLPPLPGSFRTPTFADVDGDGDPDLLLTEAAGGDVLLRNVAGTFVAVAGALPVAPTTINAALADADGDGDLDLFRGHTIGGPTLALNQGTGVFVDASARLPSLPGSAHRLAVADLDVDGDPDVIAFVPGVTVRVLWNRHRHLSLGAAPVPGQPFQVALWSEPGYGATFRSGIVGVGLTRRPTPLALPPFGRLWLDLNTPLLLAPATFAPGAGPDVLSWPVPNQPQLSGIALHLQGLLIESQGFPDARLSTVRSTVIQ